MPAANNPNAVPVIPPASGPVRLTYWAWLKDLQQVCDIWNASNPQIQVTANWIQGGNSGGYAKLYSALAAGGGPDIGQVEFRQLPEFLLAGGVTDLSRYGADDLEADYNEAAWANVVFNGSVFALPQDTGPTGFYYQPEVLADVDGVPPKTWDDWYELSGRVRQSGPSRYLDTFPVADASVFACYAQQAGARWFRTEGDEWIVDLSGAGTLKVAQLFDRAIDADLVQTGFSAYSPGWYAAAASGDIAALTSASWGDALIESVSGGSGKWKVAPMQRWSDGFGSSQLGGSTAAVLANCQHPAEAMRFIHWMTTSKEGIDAMIKFCGIGWSPAADYIGSAREGASEFFSAQRYNTEVFVPMSQEQNLDWTWSPLTSLSLNAIQDQFRRKLSAGQPLVDSLPLAQAAIVAAFRNKGLKARSAS